MQELNKCVAEIESIIMHKLDTLECGYAITKKGIAKSLKIDDDFLTVILKRMKYKGIVKIIMTWSEEDGTPDGCGYCLTSKNELYGQK